MWQREHRDIRSQLLFGIVTLSMLFILILISPSPALSQDEGDVWQPTPGTSWQWQASGALDTTLGVDMYLLDVMDTSAESIQELHDAGAVVICSFSAGTSESWRPDSVLIPQFLVGNPVSESDQESWLDIRENDLLAPILLARFNIAVSKGCDGILPGRVDGYINDSGWPLSAEDQLSFNRWLAEQAHARGLSIGLRNDGQQAAELVDDFDWALTEECFLLEECDSFLPFVEAGRAVFGVEYESEPDAFCPESIALDFDFIAKERELGATPRIDCREEYAEAAETDVADNAQSDAPEADSAVEEEVQPAEEEDAADSAETADTADTAESAEAAEDDATEATPIAHEAESNNRFGDANPIAIAATVLGTIAPERDADWYAFSVDQQGELTLLVTNTPPEMEIVLRVWNANRDTVSDWIMPLAAGGDTEGIVDLPLPGRYVIELADDGGDDSSGDPYSLQTAFVPTVDRGELNNIFGDAYPITLGAPIEANILPRRDADWYRFDVDHHGELQIDLTNVSEEMDLYARVWNANRDTLSDWLAPLGKGGDVSEIVDLPAPGSYYIEVVDGDGDARSSQPYTLLASYTAAADPFEPNNIFGQSSTLPLGLPVETNILPRRDADWYRFAIDHHGELTVSVTDVPEELDIHYRVWNANRDTVSGWLSPLAKGADNVTAVDLPEPGVYHLEVVDGDGDARALDSFTLMLSFDAAVDPFEANNIFGTATPLDTDGSVRANILPLRDADWYRVDTTHHGELTVQITEVPTDMDINFRVWNSNRDTISNWFGPLAKGGDTLAKVDLPEPGAFYIEVVDGSGDSRAIEPYRLTNSFILAADQGEPNATSDIATPVQMDSNIVGNILPLRDQDWFAFDVGLAGDLHILVTEVDPALEVSFRVWDDEGNTVSSWINPLAAGGDTSAVLPVGDAGTYYLELAERNGDARSINPYILRLSMQAIDPETVSFPEKEDEAEGEGD